jgi:hypothetical protein
MAVVGAIEAGGALRTPLGANLAALLANAGGAPLGFEIRCDELAPKFEQGDVLYFAQPEPVHFDLIGHYAACRLASGETILARVEQSQGVIWAAPLRCWVLARSTVQGNA